MKNSISEPRVGTVGQVRGHHKGSVFDELRPRLQNLLSYKLDFYYKYTTTLKVTF